MNYEGVSHPPLLLKDNPSVEAARSKVTRHAGDVNVYAVDGELYKTKRHRADGTETTEQLITTGNDTISVDTINEFTSGNGVYVDGVRLVNSQVHTNTIIELSSGAGVTVDGLWIKDSGFRGSGVIDIDTIEEYSVGQGVTVDGVRIKDNGLTASGTIKTDTINENTSNAGVTIDSVLVKDNTVTASFVEAGTMEANFINEASTGAGVTVEGIKIASSVVYTDVIESTDQANPCVIEAVSIHDNTLTANRVIATTDVQTNTINERTSGSGVTVDGVLIKDSYIHATAYVNEPFYCVMRLSGNLALSAGVATLLPINTTVVDPSSGMANTASTRMDIPAIGSVSEGVWLVVVALTLSSATVGDRTYCQLRKNGTAAQLHDIASTMASENLKFTFIERFSVGEYMTVYVSHDSTATVVGGSSYIGTCVHMSLLQRYA